MKRLVLPAVLALATVVAASPSLEAARRVVVVKKAPPKVRVEVRTAAPSPNHVWVAGHWSWRTGKYVWVGGTWKVRPTSSATWVTGHWTKRPRGWVWVPGHWKR